MDALVLARLQLEGLYTSCLLTEQPEHVDRFVKEAWKRQYIRYLLMREQTKGQEAHVLNADDIELRVSAKEPSDDVSVEVLVRCKPQHRRGVPIGAGLSVVPVCPKEETVARLPLAQLQPVPGAGEGRRRLRSCAAGST